MRLSDIKGEEAFDVLEEIIDPIAHIAADEKIAEVKKQKGATRLDIARYIMKNHRREIITILASLERKPYDEYLKEVDLFKLPMQIMDLINDPQVLSLFQSQSQNQTETSFGSATENTEVHAE